LSGKTIASVISSFFRFIGREVSPEVHPVVQNADDLDLTVSENTKVCNMTRTTTNASDVE